MFLFISYLYWTEGGLRPHIERSGLDGSDRQIVFNMTGKNMMLSALTLDIDDNAIYWCDNRLHKIRRISTTNFTDHVEVASMGCDSISVYGDKLYWVTS
jgi:hypothetical protein